MYLNGNPVVEFLFNKCLSIFISDVSCVYESDVPTSWSRSLIIVSMFWKIKNLRRFLIAIQFCFGLGRRQWWRNRIIFSSSFYQCVGSPLERLISLLRNRQMLDLPSVDVEKMKRNSMLEKKKELKAEFFNEDHVDAEICGYCYNIWQQWSLT